MQFDWTTLLLELLNFLVLVWLLKRLFYQPVLAVLDARKQAVRDQAAQAEAATRSAEAMKADYEARLRTWQQEREQARQALQQEVAQERLRQFEVLKKDLADEQAKAAARAVAQAAEREAILLRQASEHALRDVAAMLARLADPALTARIVTIVCQDLAALPETQRAALHDAAASLGTAGGLEIAAAHALDPAQVALLRAAIDAVVGVALTADVIERPDLIAGVRIAIGDRLLQANLAEELAFFRRNSATAGIEPHA